MQKLTQLQTRLKAPKGQYNSFGKYKYRSLEDITEAVKPIMAELGLHLTISDEIQLVGDRYYIKATATITDTEADEKITVSAYAREAEEQKGMSEGQLTGATSSYARKYALNGLFALDDTKDLDTDENQTERMARTAKNDKKNNFTYNEDEPQINQEQLAAFLKLLDQKGKTREEIEKAYNKPLALLTLTEHDKAVKKLEKMEDK